MGWHRAKESATATVVVFFANLEAPGGTYQRLGEGFLFNNSVERVVWEKERERSRHVYDQTRFQLRNSGKENRES